MTARKNAPMPFTTITNPESDSVRYEHVRYPTGYVVRQDGTVAYREDMTSEELRLMDAHDAALRKAMFGTI